ncbi:hypothetical protein LCGC14_0929030 [marine sediment metagenome]|uniref:Uncharacterized protein n=1 Tax=marine sediment metagenome TaxID=412755 RepID=A0A0F9P9E9_9ZZZZ
MSLVYRIQSKQDRTRGAYRSHVYGDDLPDIVHRMRNTHHDYQCGGKHPTPLADTKRYIYKHEFCGFNSAADLLRWFKGFIPDLLRAGYEIVALRDVTVTAVGEFQVLFTFNT